MERAMERAKKLRNEQKNIYKVLELRNLIESQKNPLIVSNSQDFLDCYSEDRISQMEYSNHTEGLKCITQK